MSELKEIAIKTDCVIVTAVQKKKEHSVQLTEEEGWESKRIVDNIGECH